MLLRTPPPKRQRSETRAPESPPAAGSGRRLVIYEDPPSAAPSQPSESEHLLCTYQCRQMVCNTQICSVRSISQSSTLNCQINLFFLFLVYTSSDFQLEGTMYVPVCVCICVSSVCIE
jgi:hypothetical protein